MRIHSLSSRPATRCRYVRGASRLLGTTGHQRSQLQLLVQALVALHQTFTSTALGSLTANARSDCLVWSGHDDAGKRLLETLSGELL